MTPKQFLRQSGLKVAADSFLESYSDHIKNNYPEATIALDMFKSGELLPTPALEFVREVVKQHLMQTMINKAEKSIEKQVKQEQEGTQKKDKKSSKGTTGTGKFSAQIFVKETSERTGESKIVLFVDHNGNSTFKSATHSDALRLVDRKQSDVYNAQYAVIENEIAEGRMMTSTVTREDSMSRFLRAPRGPVMKVKPQSADMKQTMSVHNYVATFSRG